MKILTLLFSCALLLACAPMQPNSSYVYSAPRSPTPYNPSYTAAAVTLDTDEFDAQQQLISPLVKWGLLPTGLPDKMLVIRTFVDPKQNKVITHQLYFTIMYHDDWRRFERASLEDASPVETVIIDRDVLTCSSEPCLLTESIGAMIPPKFFASKAETGFRIKFSAQSGADEIVEITPGQIAAQLGALQRDFPKAK